MARVYLADDLDAGREVAVKLLKPELASAIAGERFLREIHLIAALRHPNIVPLLDAGELNGVPYFAMPYLEGESLRLLLRRERQLPVATALRITHALARALEAAHAVGIVHRDVKPENVLISGDDVLLADFGIARAFTESSDDRLTESGITLGTPGYMSPEQSAGEKDLDGRSDIYSLGCLAYEMLSGEPPFTGPTTQAVLAKQLTLAVSPVHVVRETLPEQVDEVLRTALAKVPADRYARATAFAQALEAATRVKVSGAQQAVRRMWRSPRSRIALVGMAVAALAWLASNGAGDSGEARGGPAPDTTRYAVIPLATTGGARAALGEGGALGESAARAVRDAMLRWTGITLADEALVRERLARLGGGAISGRGAASLARAAGAGRYVRFDIISAKDAAMEVRLQLHSAVGEGVLLREARGRAGGVITLDSLAPRLVDSLLLRDALVPDEPLSAGTRSLPARQAYAHGRKALEDWMLSDADSSFAAATRFDTKFAHAQLWLAVTRLWSGSEPNRWRIAAEQAMFGAGTLTARERTVAEAVLAQSQNDLGRACARWRELTARDTLDAFAWFGSAQCQMSDNAVLRDGASPSGWRFRSSYHTALQEYQRSFRLHPPILSSFRDGGYESLRRLFRTAGNEPRGGYALAQPRQRFTSVMEWRGDSLALVPYPQQGVGPLRLTRNEGKVNEALRHQRELVRAVSSSWVAAFPRSAGAWQALSMALASLGDISSLDTLARAAALAQSAEERARVASARVALQFAFALRDADTVGLAGARKLADSLLSAAGDVRGGDPFLLSSLAALTGRAGSAVRYARAPAVGEAMRTPPDFRELVPPLLIYAALWGPADTLALLERRVSDLIDRRVPPAERAGRRMEWLARAASLAFPGHRFAQLEKLGAEGDPLVQLQVALVRGDTGAVRQGIASFGRERRGITPENLTLDALVPEAALILRTGDARGAVSWLDPTLAALPLVAPQLLSSPVRAASLATAAMLRARSAALAGDVEGARRWGTAVVILWSDADPFLQDMVREARMLAR